MSCVCIHPFHFQNYTGAASTSIALNASCAYPRTCAESPCLNGGTCRSNGSCTCPPQYLGTACQFFNACSSSPCLNSGKCAVNLTVPAQYTCSCLPGTAGANCEIQPCSANPCQNGGICQSSGGNYSCVCTSGYFGTNCTMPLNPCSNSTCMNGGTCLGMGGSFTCSCSSGYTGSICEVPITTCNNYPCANGATCIPQAPDGFTCACASGFTGVTCLQDINECLLSPCQNGGTCANSIGSFACSCPASYTGPLCSSTVDYCAGQPCGSNGTCEPLPLLGTYRCMCLPGYTGPRCGSIIDRCSPHPCANGATCVGWVNTYSCLCAPGYTGARCEHDLCFNAPCANGGTCSLGNGSYVCACPQGWDGLQCQNAVSVSSKLAWCGLTGSLDALVASNLISSYVDTVSLPTAVVQASPISLNLSPATYGLYFSAWVWQDGDTPGTLTLLTTNTFSAALLSDPRHSLISFNYSSPSGAQLISFPTSRLTSRAWHHVMFSVDVNGTASVSVDGAHSQQMTITGFTRPLNATVTLVPTDTSVAPAFTGLMRAVAVAALQYPQVDLYSVEACLMGCSDSDGGCVNGQCVDLIGDRRVCQCYYGYTGLLCQSLHSQFSFSGMGRAEVTNVNPRSLSLAFGFNDLYGLLLSLNASTLSAALNGGSMLIRAQPCGYASSNISLSLSNQHWHQLQMSIPSSGSSLSVSVDASPSSIVLNNATCSPSPPSLTLGALAGGFSGCVRALQLDGAQLDASAVLLTGDATLGCSHSTARFHDYSQLTLPPLAAPVSQNISFSFATMEPQGTMYFSREVSGDATLGIPTLDFLTVYLKGGQIAYAFSVDHQSTVQLCSFGTYSDGLWHRVDIRMNFFVDGKGMMAALGVLSVDGKDTVTGFSTPGPLGRLDTTGPVILGSVPLDQQAQTGLSFADFHGCIQDLTQNGMTTDLLEHDSSQHVSFGNCN